jgi:hypothetical protein
MRMRDLLIAVAFALFLVSCSGARNAALPPSSAPAGGAQRARALSLSPPTFTDWPTFGDNLQRTNDNPNEAALGSTTNAASLTLAWSRDLGAAITDQPIIAANLSINGTPTPVAYIGTEGGVFYALNAATGATIWSRQLGTITSACMDLPGGTFGITSTATFDRSTNPPRIYVADGKDRVYALNMVTGATISGWPVKIANQFTENHVYGALTLSNGTLYVGTGSFCDYNAWNGRIVAINTTSAGITATFYPGGRYNGGGVWGIGGAAVDSSGNIDIAAGNDESTEHLAYGDHVIELSAPGLAVLASNWPNVPGDDEDFGATPAVYAGPCGRQTLSVKNKAGYLYTYYASAIASGPVQSLQMAPQTSEGEFIGTTAYSPATHQLYVGVPAGSNGFTQGLASLSQQSDCTLAKAWEASYGPAGVTGNDNDSVTVASNGAASGVVYFTDGIGHEAFAFDESGSLKWRSGGTIQGPVMVAATVDGYLFVSSWDHHLYAFGI